MSPGGVVAEAQWGTGARRSLAELLCGNAEADCYLSHCGSHYPGHPQHCPGHPELQKIR